MAEQSQQAGIKKTVRKTSLIVLGMCGFAFALVPLYDLFCEVTGLNGKPVALTFLTKRAQSQIALGSLKSIF